MRFITMLQHDPEFAHLLSSMMPGELDMHRNIISTCFVLIISFGPWNNPPARCGESQPAVSRASARLDVTRDAWVSDVGAEADGNNGGAPRLKLKGIQEMSLVDIDPKSLVGRTVGSAALHLMKAGDEPLQRVTVSSVGAEWFEGTASNYARPAGRRHVPPSAVSRPHLVDRRRRPHPRGPGQRRHTLADGRCLTPGSERMAAVPVDPRVVAARVAGVSHGFLVFDDTGSEWTRSGEKFTFQIFPNRFVFSQDQNRASATVFHHRVGAGRSPTAGSPERPAGGARDGTLAGRRGAGRPG